MQILITKKFCSHRSKVVGAKHRAVHVAYMEAWLHAFLTSAADGGEWSLCPGERSPKAGWAQSPSGLQPTHYCALTGYRGTSCNLLLL
jgi:hypothetical protein